MTVHGYSIAGRTIAMVVGVLLLIGVISFGVTQCQKRQSQASQSRVERSQAEAASNSAADAIGTVTRRGVEETASEALTRENERAIRSADGASERARAGVDVAGRQALCRREAYRNDPKCAIFRKDGR